MKGNHSAASTETEIKLWIPPGRALESRLRRLGFRVAAPRRFERNALFDFEDRRLSKDGAMLRLRSENGRTLLTFKGSARPSKRYKIRREIEVEVDDAAGQSLRTILRAAGLRQVFRYEKFRTTYAPSPRARGPQGLAFFDETPIGNYLELEGTPQWIDRTARSLGLSPEAYITASYAKLYLDACRRRGVKPGNMVFRKVHRPKRKT